MRSKFKKCKLGTLISEISDRNNRNQSDRVYSVTNSKGFIQSTDYFDKEVFSKDISNYKIVKQYQFAYNPSRINVGSIAYLQEQDDVVVSPLYVVFSCTDDLVPEYLLKFIKSPIGLTNVKNKTRGSVRESLNYKTLSDIEIPLPTVVEQLKIATILGKVESLIRRRKESIDLLDEFLKSIFEDMFGDPAKNEKGWETSTLKNLAKIRIGPFGSLLHQEDYVTDGIPLVNPSHIISGKIVVDWDLTITAEKIRLLSAYVLEENDVILARRGEMGRCAVVTKKEAGYLCGTGSIFIRPEESLNSVFLHNIISSAPIRLFLGNSAKGSTMKNLNSGIVENLKIPFPPIKIQNEFAAIVEKTQTLKARFQSILNDLEELYASLSQRAFNGELDLTAVEIDDTLLPEDKKEETTISIPPDIQKAIALSDKINKQFDGINRITKVPSALTKQLEQWNKLQDQFKNITKLPEAFLQAQKNIERIQEAIDISKSGTRKIIVEEEIGFNWAVLANRIKERYKDRHFNFEMLHSFIQKAKLAKATPYYASEELKINPRLNDAEDLKSFIQTAIQNIEMDEKQQRQTNPFLRLTQFFYNAEEENFTLSLHNEDFKLIKDKTARQRSGIYFSLATEV